MKRSVLLSCSEQMLPDASLNERLRLVREAGFDGIDLRAVTASDPAARRTLADDGLAIGAVYSQLKEPSPLARSARERSDAIDQVQARAEAAAAVGAPNLIVVPIFGPPQIAMFPGIMGVEELETAHLLAALDEIAARIASLPVTVVVEPLNGDETHFLTSPTRAATIGDAAASPRVATMVDTYHCQRNGQDVSGEIVATGDHLALIHLSDTDHQLPGNGTVDFGAALATPRQRGYTGWMGFECRPGADVAALRHSVHYLRQLDGKAKDDDEGRRER